MNDSIEIRVLKTHTELKQVEELENLIWRSDAIPIHQTITAIKNGGLMLGAYVDENLIGFSYGFPGYANGEIYLCSHNLGIHPDYQVKGIGALLKKEQKKVAISMGYRMMTWTYDPLETRNAYLNLSKLGGICCTYVENCYGELEDGLNSGLPTDRFKVEWWIESDHVKKHRSFTENDLRMPHHSIGWHEGALGLPQLDTDSLSRLPMDGKPIVVPVPVNFQTLKQQNPELAMEWRMKTREIFQSLFKKDYAAVSLLRSAKGPVHHYILEKKSNLAIPL